MSIALANLQKELLKERCLRAFLEFNVAVTVPKANRQTAPQPRHTGRKRTIIHDVLDAR